MSLPGKRALRNTDLGDGVCKAHRLLYEHN